MPFPQIKLTRRPLHFFYLCDCSGSMAAQGKIQSLNQAIRQSLPGMAAAALQTPEAAVYVRAIRFASEASWHIQEPTLVDQVVWPDLQAEGLTAMGAALRLLAEELDGGASERHALPPVIVLISDGQPTDEFAEGLRCLMDHPWASKAVRLAIGIGQDADTEVLQQFIGPPGGGESATDACLRPLQATNATSLAHYIHWASTAVVGSASQPATAHADLSKLAKMPLPDLPPTILAPANEAETITW